MWYREAKQGSLWSIISPTFERDVAEAINLSTLSGVIDLDLFQKNFRNIPNNNLSDYEFRYVPKSELGEGSGAHCDRVNKEILIDENKQYTPAEITKILFENFYNYLNAIHYLIYNDKKL